MNNPTAPNLNNVPTRNTMLQLEALVEESYDAIIGKTLDGVIVRWNRGATRMFGYTSEEIIGKSLAELFIPECRTELPALLERIDKGETITEYNSIWIRKDGTCADVEFSFSPIHSDKGLIIGTSLIGRDISKRKKVEQRLQQLAIVIEESHDAIISKTLDGIITSWNHGATKMFGYTPEEIIGKPIGNIVSPDHKGEILPLLEKVRKGEVVIDYDSIWIRKDGTLADVEFSVSPIHGKENEIIGASIVGRDISQRKREEEQIRIFSDAVACALDCFLLTDVEGNVTYANESAIVTFGYTPEEFLKINISSLDADPEVGKKVMQEIKAKGKWSGEVTNIKKNKQLFPSFLSAYIIIDKKGNPKGTMGIIRNITDQKNAEEKFKKKYDDMEKLYNATLDRELKMVELKKEIEVLKAKP